MSSLSMGTITWGHDDLDRKSWSGQLAFLRDVDDGLQARMVLSTMSAKRLFETAVFSRKHFSLVVAFLDFLRNNDVDEDEMSVSDADSSYGSDASVSEGGNNAFSDVDMELETGSDSTTDIDSESATDVGSDSATSYTELKTQLFGGKTTAPTHTSLYDMPVELGLDMIGRLSFEDRVRIAQASRPAASIVAQSLQDDATCILRPFGLRFCDVRLMQTATGAIVAGSAVTALVQNVAGFHPGDLDFLVGLGRGRKVVAFLAFAGSYRKTDDSPEYSFARGVGCTWTLYNEDGKRINIMETMDGNPFQAVGNFHLTCVYGAWCANGLLHWYPSLTVAGHAITTRAKLPYRHDDHPHHTGLWCILHKYADRGFTIALNEYDTPHTCGVDWSCPATLRRTDDAGCSYSAFPAWLYDDDAETLPVCCWTMGGTGCATGILGGAAPVYVATSDLGAELRRL
ncbi:hypothetical protein C8R47DRAFT_1067866 [Mycena vitilis]|nr:hypothetical protein C8R47DRAFT_1067866 [Mycena vitilis]